MIAIRSRKLWPWVCGAILLLLISGLMLINHILAPEIRKKLTAAVSKASDGGYKLQIEKVEINVFTGALVLNNVYLTGDTFRLKDKPVVVQGKAQIINVTGLSLWQYFLHKKLVIKDVVVDGAILGLTRQSSTDSYSHKSETIYQKLSGTLKMVSVDHIQWRDIHFAYFVNNKQPARLQLQKVDLDARGLLIDSATQSDTSRTLYCRNIIAGVRDINGTLQAGAYHYHLTYASYSTITKRLTATGMALKPQELHRFFAHIHAERFDVAMDSIAVENFDYQRYFIKNSFHAGKISAYRGHVNVFGDPSGKSTPGDRVTGFPNYALRQIQIPITADTVDVMAIEVSYSELNLQDGKIGTINFSQTAGRFLHITNDTAQLKKNAWCNAHIKSKFMGRGELDLTARFNLADRSCSYYISGKLAPMEAVAINKVTMPLGLVRIKSGQLRSLTFDITGDQFKNTGNLQLLYHDADLDILGNQYHTRPLQTLLANALVIAHNNPDDPGAAPRVARLHYTRPVSKAFFCTLWQTLFEGIESCVEKTKSSASSPPHQSLVKKILTAPVHLFKKKS
jgi:hypothetical protein